MTGRRVRVHGLVQGVGFRPYVWRLATELGLAGWVRNDSSGVTIEVAGSRVNEFLDRLPAEIPRLARIDGIEVETADVVAEGFTILESAAGAVATAIGPDAAMCPDCIADVCDPVNRRWRYAFTTCTHCGPRYTVSRGIPYDRAQTSLAEFSLCPACQAEYLAPANRRFHAETTCCPVCGPSLSLLDAAGEQVAGDPIAQTLERLQSGQIVAVKGLGGFLLACDARNAGAVAELRRRKQREEKPFAVMAQNAASLAEFAQIGTAERILLTSPAAPIVLCPKAQIELPGIAPGLAWLGVALPNTPIQLLLWHEALGRPAGTDWLSVPNDMLLVMTSANPHGEPLVRDNLEAMQRLAGLADAYLLHNRDIVVRCDDSVIRPGPAFIRRARGYTPVPIALARDGPVVLALGAHLKNTVCVAKRQEAYLSQHIGGLDNAPAIDFLEETVSHLLTILDVRPEVIVHDLHPDYASTQLALQLADQWGVPTLAVAHHHAHIGAICAEHGLNGTVLGLAIDGVGLGPDGGLWGGELLRVDGPQCTRLGHLQSLHLPGGDRAAREPWRMAVSALYGAGRAELVKPWLKKHYPDRQAGPLLTLLNRGLNCPPTSSLGRLFDAAAGLLGVRGDSHFEGQAAMELEGLAVRHGPVQPLSGGATLSDARLDFSPLLLALSDCDDAAYGAALFHASVAHGLAQWLLRAVQREQVKIVAVSGGCAMNAVLMVALRLELEAAGVTVFEAQQAPPNDGGLALGQAWVARQQQHMPLAQNPPDGIAAKWMQ